MSLESSLSELRDPTQYVGLKNLGATCYVNSLIQMWFHNEDMRSVHLIPSILIFAEILMFCPLVKNMKFHPFQEDNIQMESHG